MSFIKREEVQNYFYRFYREYFAMDSNLSDLENLEPNAHLKLPITIIPGVTRNMAVSVTRDLDKEVCVNVFGNLDLDEAVTDNERQAGDKPYLIWVQGTREPDMDSMYLSAQDFSSKEIPSETLLERLIHGIVYYDLTKKHYDLTKKHLDCEAATLCSGSRFMDPNMYPESLKLLKHEESRWDQHTYPRTPYVSYDADCKEMTIGSHRSTIATYDDRRDPKHGNSPKVNPYIRGRRVLCDMKNVTFAPTRQLLDVAYIGPELKDVRIPPNYK